MANCPSCNKTLKQESYGYHCTNRDCALFGQVRATPELPEKEVVTATSGFADPRIASMQSVIDNLEARVATLEAATLEKEKPAKK